MQMEDDDKDYDDVVEIEERKDGEDLEEVAAEGRFQLIHFNVHVYMYCSHCKNRSESNKHVGFYLGFGGATGGPCHVGAAVPANAGVVEPPGKCRVWIKQYVSTNTL